jgi:hypothetical protein
MRLLTALALVVCACSASSSDDAGQCRDTSKNPSNFIENPGFECGGTAPAEWSTVYGTLSFPAEGRSGRAGKVVVDQTGGRIAYTIDLTKGGTKSYCFTAYVRGTTPFMRLRVFRDLGNGNLTSYDFAAPVTADWSKVPGSFAQKVPFGNAERLQLLFEAQTGRSDGLNAKAGDTLLIDDVDGWVSTSGNCDER